MISLTFSMTFSFVPWYTTADVSKKTKKSKQIKNKQTKPASGL
jgi:hypothetical protein